MKKRIKIIFIGLFLGISLIPSIGMLFYQEENRANQILAAKPSLTEKNGSLNQEVLSDIEKYTAEHFAFRQELITANASLLARGFMTSNHESVILGKDGWLFYADTLGDYLGVQTMSEREVYCAAITLALMQEQSETRGQDFLFLLVPNKNTVYGQWMSDRYPVLSGEGNRERLAAALEEKAVSYVDFTDSFRASAATLYHKLDSHWNNGGAAYAYEIIMEQLGREYLSYRQMNSSETYDFTGDLYEMLYPAGREKDWNVQYEQMPVFEVTNGAESDAIRYETKNPAGQGRLVMYRDSFGNALAPFLAGSFAEAYFTRETPYQMADSTEAEVVVVELAQRRLPTLVQRAPIMEAPKRELEEPKQQRKMELELEKENKDNFIKLEGTYQFDGDVDSSVYLRVDGVCYEVFVQTDEAGKEQFTAYLPENQKAEKAAVLYYVEGKLTKSEERIVE